MTRPFSRLLAPFLLPLLSLTLLVAAPAGAQSPPLPAPAGNIEYVARPGDTMIGLSRRLLIDGQLASVQRALQLHNGLNSQKEADRIEPGRVLRIPVNWLRSEASRIEVESSAGEVNAAGPVSKGTVIPPGQEISTGKTGQVTLRLADGSTLTLKPGSAMTVEKSATSPLSKSPDAIFNLKNGRVETEVARRTGGAARFEIRTPVAVAAVRGTRFRVTAGDGGAFMTSEVLEGQVEVADTGKRGQVSLEKETGTRANPGQAPLAPRRLLPAPRLWGGSWLARKPGASMRMLPVKGAEFYRVSVSQGRTPGGTVLREWDLKTLDVELPELANGEYLISVRAVDDIGLEGLEASSQLTVQIAPAGEAAQKPAGNAANNN
jgi:hypothetical protein